MTFKDYLPVQIEVYSYTPRTIKYLLYLAAYIQLLLAIAVIAGTAHIGWWFVERWIK